MVLTSLPKRYCFNEKVLSNVIMIISFDYTNYRFYILTNIIYTLPFKQVEL